MKYTIFSVILLLCFACKNEVPQQKNAPTEAMNTATTQNNPAYVEFTTTANGLEVYNAYLEVDTTDISSGNVYLKNYMNYEMYNKIYYLDKNDEIMIAVDIDAIKMEDLNTYHPYLIRVNLMPKPANINNCQHIVVDFKNGFPTTHRALQIRARTDGWQDGAVHANNFKPCTEDKLECNAQALLQGVITLLFR